MIDKILEQRISLKFLAKLKKTFTESYKLLQDVYGESVLSKECAFEWHKRFSEGREDILDDAKSDHQPSRKTRENVEKVRQLVHSNRKISTRVIANKLGISKETVRRILTVDLRMVKALPRYFNSKGKATAGGVNGVREETGKREKHFGSKFAELDQGKSEDSDYGEWDDIEHVEGTAGHPEPKEEHNEVIIKQEMTDEEDCLMDDDPISNENVNTVHGEMRNPPWNFHYNQEHHIGSNAAEPEQQSSDSSDVGDWGEQEHVEAAVESVEQTESSPEKNSVHEVMVKQEVMEEEEDDVMDENFNSTPDINGEFEESEEPPWDEPPPFENIPVSAEMEEDFESNQVGYDEFEAMNSSDQNEVQSGYICHYCNQSFVTKRQLYGHMAWHSRKGRYEFQDTPHGRSRSRAIAGYSTSISKVRSWLHSKQAEMKFTCLDCSEEFVGVGAFTSHKGIHRQQDRKFYCSVCSHTYPRAIDLIFHEWTNHTGDRPFPCDRCPSAFARQTSWTYHIIAHINNGAKFPNGRMRLNSSSKPQAPSSLDSPSNEESTQRAVALRSTPVEGRDLSQLEASPVSTRSYPFKCLTCGKGISNEESWEYHLAVHPSGGETRQNLSPSNLERLRALLLTTLTCENKAAIACLECGLETVGIFALARHKSDQHLTKGGYRCTVCHKRVENVHKYIRHEMTHTKVKIYVCEMCGKEMADRMSFIHHIIVHFKDQQCEPLPIMVPINCSTEPDVTDTPKREEVKDNSFHHLVQRLLEPIKAFLKQELVPCLQCGQVFQGIQRLVSHKESHTNNSTGNLRFTCWVCSEVFESAKSLVEHEWTHTGMKPYKCDQCEQRFSSKIVWVGHVRGHFLEGRKSHPN